MARKNMFEGITPAADAPVAPASLRTPDVFRQAGPIAAIRNDLRTVGARSVQEVSADLIEDTGLRDRLEVETADIVELRDSIARYGQQVPILLRPHPSLSGRYQVVYGRRRLAAMRGLDQPIKALIRTMSDEEAVLAQGQENNLRKDPSFIEKTLFAGDLEEAGYEPRVIQDALNVNRSHTSHMRKVREAFPRALIERIGPAPSVGWKRWYEAASRVLEAGLDPLGIAVDFADGLPSDERFALWIKGLDKALAAPAPKAPAPVKAQDKETFLALSRRGQSLTLKLHKSTGGFAAWLETHLAHEAEALYRAYLEEAKETTRSTAAKGAVTE